MTGGKGSKRRMTSMKGSRRKMRRRKGSKSRKGSSCKGSKWRIRSRNGRNRCRKGNKSKIGSRQGSRRGVASRRFISITFIVLTRRPSLSCGKPEGMSIYVSLCRICLAICPTVNMTVNPII